MIQQKRRISLQKYIHWCNCSVQRIGLVGGKDMEFGDEAAIELHIDVKGNYLILAQRFFHA